MMAFLVTVALLAPLLLFPGYSAEGVGDAAGAPKSRHLVVLFPLPPAEGEYSRLSPQDARVLSTQLRRDARPTNAGNSSVSECLRERSVRGIGLCWASTPCLGLKSFIAEDNKAQYNGISSSTRDCDILLYWLDEFPMEGSVNEFTDKPSILEVWGYGILSTALISLSGIGGIVLYPIMTKGYFKEVMNFLLGLAFGSLSATSIFQLLPESFGVMEFDEDYLLKALMCWGSIWIFYNIGIITTMISGKREHSHGHSHAYKSENHDAKSKTEHQLTKNGLEMSTNPRIPDEEEKKVFLNTTESVDFIQGEKVNIKKITAIMIIFGDGLHNFVDGMSIGAGYSQSLVVGLSISLGVACEEFPHEFGDFAVLIKSGFSFKKALKFNYASASTIFLGLITGILLGQLDASIYIYAFSGGLFLYISLGVLVPELKDMIKEDKTKGFKPVIVAYLLQNLGMLMGVLALFFVTKYL